MHIGFYKHIEKYLINKNNVKILILNDPYYSYNATQNNNTIYEHLKSIKNIKVLEDINEYSKLKIKYDIIINIFFSSIFIDQKKFYNQILKISKLETRFINILPFLGFINYSYLNFNPNLFKFINVNKNFRLQELAFLDKYGKKLQIKESHIDKIFFQTTEKRNQSFVDHLYNELNKNFDDTVILFDTKIIGLEEIKYDYYKPTRLGHHLSGHSSKTWVDEGAFKKLVELINFKSLIDVGCGPGGIVKFSNSLGIKSIGVDGDNSISRDIENDFYLHDYTKGLFDINLKFDLCWCVEFLEHVEEKYIKNYFDTFKKCKYVFCTYAPRGKGGYHHVNTQDEIYWINKFNEFNFRFEGNKSKLIRQSSTISKNFVRNYGLLFKNKSF